MGWLIAGPGTNLLSTLPDVPSYSASSSSPSERKAVTVLPTVFSNCFYDSRRNGCSILAKDPEAGHNKQYSQETRRNHDKLEKVFPDHILPISCKLGNDLVAVSLPVVGQETPSRR
jgi:hypothetical protein